MMPIMGGLLLICYVWGRYYANKLDYARTIQNLLADSDNDSASDGDNDEDLTSHPEEETSNNTNTVRGGEGLL